MTRIIIESTSGQELEVEQAVFDAGFFPGYWYVRDAGPSGSTEPAVLDGKVRDLVTDGTSQTAAALRAAFGSSPIPAGRTGGGWTDPRTGLYLASAEPLRRWETAVSKAQAGVAHAHWMNLGDSIIAVGSNYAGTSSDFLRKLLRTRYNIAALTGMLFMVDKADSRVSYPAGAGSDWVNQVGYGPVGKSALNPSTTTARVRFTFTEDDPFDQVAVTLVGANTAANVVSSVDGGTESAPAWLDTPWAYSEHIFPMGSLATTHSLTLGTADTAWKPYIVSVEPRRSDNKYISVTRSGVGGAQTTDFLSHATGYEQPTGSLMFVPSTAQPDLLTINLGVNDWLVPDAFHTQTSLAQYRTNLAALAAWAKPNTGVVQFQTQTPNQDTSTTPTQDQYAQVMYDLVDANPTSMVATDLLAEWVSYANFSALYSDSTHPGTGLQGYMARLQGRISRR